MHYSCFYNNYKTESGESERADPSLDLMKTHQGHQRRRCRHRHRHRHHHLSSRILKILETFSIISNICARDFLTN